MDRPLGQPDEAREHLETFSQFGAQKDADFREMRAGLNDADRMRRAVVNALMTAGELYAQDGRVQQAEARWKRAAQLDEKHGPCREMLSVLYARQRRFGEALELREELCRLVPERPDYWLGLGRIFVQCGRPTEAEAPLRRAIKLAPQRPGGYVALADVYMLPGHDPWQAVELARTAVRLSPTAAHYSLLATACAAAGDRTSARAAAEQAMRLEPANPRYWEANPMLQEGPSE